MWEPQPLTTLRASKACREENFTFTLVCLSVCLFFIHLHILHSFGRIRYDGTETNYGDFRHIKTSRKFWKLNKNVGFLPPAFTLASCLAYFSILKMEAICSSKTSVEFQRNTRRYIPGDRILHNHLWENLRSWKLYLLFENHSSSRIAVYYIP
jgi:hypothetical protein